MCRRLHCWGHWTLFSSLKIIFKFKPLDNSDEEQNCTKPTCGANEFQVKPGKKKKHCSEKSWTKKFITWEGTTYILWCINNEWLFCSNTFNLTVKDGNVLKSINDFVVQDLHSTYSNRKPFDSFNLTFMLFSVNLVVVSRSTFGVTR